MSAFLAFIGGAAGEFNRMSEEQRIALAQKKKQEAEAAAARQAKEDEFNLWKRQQEFTTTQNKNKEDADAQRKNAERQAALTRGTPELYFRNQNDPNNLYFFSQIGDTPTIESIPRVKGGMSFDDAVNLAKAQNPLVSGMGYQYLPEPTDETGTKYKIVMKELKDDDTVFSTREQAELAATANNEYYKTVGLDDFASVIESTDKGWVIKTQTKPKPEKPEAPVDPKTGVEFGPNYYFRISSKFGPETGKTAQQRGGKLIPLRPNLPMSGPEMADTEEGVDWMVIYTAPMGVEGDVDIAEANMKNFFEDFPPDVVKNIIARKETGFDVPFEAMRLQFRNAVNTWNKANAEKTDSGITYLPISEFHPEVVDYIKLDPSFGNTLMSLPAEEDLAESLSSLGAPINEPVTMTQDGGGQVKLRPVLAEAFASVDEADGRLKYSPEFMQKADLLANNGKTSRGFVYDLLDVAETNGQNIPEASREALADLMQNLELMKDLEFVSVRSGRGIYQMPNIISKRAARIQQNLVNFPTHGDRISALSLTVPNLTAKGALAKTLVSSSNGPESLYTAVTGNNNYDKLDPRMANARKVIQTANTVETLIESGGAPVGLPAEVQLLQASANYLIDSVLPTIQVATDSKINTDKLRSEIQGEYSRVNKITDDETRKNSLVRLNMRIMTYAYASMMDENGRLSDQDREQADLAIGGTGWRATPVAVLTTARALRERSQYRLAVDSGYTSNDPRRVVSAHLYSTLAGGEIDPIVELLAKTGVRKDERSQDPAQTTSEQKKQLELLY